MTADTNIPVTIPPFLAEAGWHDAALDAVPGDASFRRYFRLKKAEGQRAILMHAPPPHEDPQPFLDVTDYLRQNNFRAPEIYAADAGQGLILLEDFGDRRMREHLDAQLGDEDGIYRAAIDTLVRLEKAPVADIAPYDEAVYLRETGLLAEWYIPAMGLNTDADAYDALWAKILAPLADAPAVTVLRDYHAENIMLLDDDAQGLIDYQDALIGHPAYDLVSILQDARRDVSPKLEAAMLHHYTATAKPDYDLSLHYALLGAQRNTKIIGIFTRLWKRDGKERYLDFLPRMWGLLERDLAHPGLSPLKTWFDANIPVELRATSPLDHAI
jgi:aminoglycoside/choline kinase family phosphotransferase